METNSDWIQRIADQSKQMDEDAAEKFGELDVDQLNWRPDKETWSIAQQFHHLNLGNQRYVEIIERLARAAGPSVRPYHPGFMGRMLLKAVGPGDSLPVPVPKSMVPTESRLDRSVLDEFAGLQRRYHAALATLGAKDLNAKFASPIASWVKLKLGDAVHIVERHNARHLGKALALQKRPEFPG